MIDSIRKGVVIILSSDSHVNVMEWIIMRKKNGGREKREHEMWGGRVIQLFSSTTRLLCCYSPSHFFSSILLLLFPSLLHLILSSRTQTYPSIDLNQRRKKKRFLVFFLLLLVLLLRSPHVLNWIKRNTSLTFSFSLVLVYFIFTCTGVWR